MKNITTALVLALLLPVACGSLDEPPADTAVAREFYEVHVQLSDDEAAELHKTCPGLNNVRALTAPQPSGVDVRVEYSSFVTDEQAECIDDYLKAHGAKEFETETSFPDYDPPAGSSTESG